MPTVYYGPSVCNCDGVDYTKTDIENAAALALELAKKGRTIGDDRYPHVYNDYEHFNFAHAEAPYLVFPILQKGKIYDGLSPGAERLVLGSISEDFSSAIYCACLTKDGQRKNGFAECKDDTMNPRGKGMLPTEERKLVGRIDL